MSRLEKHAYDTSFRQRLLAAKPINASALLADAPPLSNQFAYRVGYRDPREFRQIAHEFGLMEDFRSGIPRTAYFGVVPFVARGGARVYAVHKNTNLSRPFGESFEYVERFDAMSRYLDFAAAYCKPSKCVNCRRFFLVCRGCKRALVF